MIEEKFKDLRGLIETPERIQPVIVSGKYYFDRVHIAPVGETELENLVKFIAENNPGSGSHGVHIGAAGFLNLDFITARKAQGAVLFDINANQRVMWQHVLDIISRSSDRHECFQELAKLPGYIHNGNSNNPELETITLEEAGSSDPNLFGDHPHIRGYDPKPELDVPGFQAYLEHAYNNPYSFLGSDEAFEHLKALVENDAIACINADLANTKEFQRLVSDLSEQSIPVTFFYPSNIRFWSHQPFLESFFSSGPGSAEPSNGQISQDYVGQAFNDKSAMTAQLGRMNDTINVVCLTNDTIFIEPSLIEGQCWPHSDRHTFIPWINEQLRPVNEPIFIDI